MTAEEPTLYVRDGESDAVDFYTARDRIRIGDPMVCRPVSARRNSARGDPVQPVQTACNLCKASSAAR
jgi:hypothetical protein